MNGGFPLGDWGGGGGGGCQFTRSALGYPKLRNCV